MTKIYLLAGVLACTLPAVVFSQVKISTSPGAPQAGAMLEIESSSRGLLLPRLNATQIAAIPVTASSAGLTVYHVDSSQLYLYNGQRWRPVSYSDSAVHWSLRGNQQLNPSLHFLGSTDSTDVAFRSNNQLRQILKANGRVGFGTDNPSSGFQITIRSTDQQNDDLRFENYFTQSTTGTPSLVILNSRGTPQAPQNLQVGDVIGGLVWQGRVNNSNANLTGMISYLTSGGTEPSSDLLIYNSGLVGMYLGPTGLIGMGTDAPQAGLDVASGPFFGKSSIQSSAYSTVEYGTFTMFRARGTVNSPQAVVSGDALGEIRFNAQLGGLPRTAAQIRADYVGNGLASDLRTNLSFYTSGTVAPQVTINNQGFVGVGTSLPFGALDILNDNRGDAYDDIRLSSYGPNSGPALLILKSRGTATNPQNLANGDFLGIMQFAGWVNNSYTGLSQIIAGYTGNGTSLGSNLQFRTSQTQGMVLDDRGWLSAGDPNVSPRATVDVRGSMAWRVSAADGSTLYNVAANDLVVQVAATSLVTTVQLPNSSDQEGRLLIIRNAKAGSINVATTGSLVCRPATTCGTLAANVTVGFLGTWTGSAVQWIQLF